MENFLERKEKYLRKLCENTDTVEKIYDSAKTEVEKRNLEVILSPSNEKELNISELMFDFYNDTYSIVDDAKNGNLNEIPVEENEGLKEIVRFVNLAKKGEKIDFSKYYENSESIKRAAEISYSGIVGLYADMDSSFDYVFKKCGFDEDSFVDLTIFRLYMERLQESASGSTLDYRNYSDKDFENYKMFFQEFHKLYVEGKKENNKTKRQYFS